jgi:hypothetical protein
MTDTIPIFPLRDVIGSMEVYCSSVTINDDESNKRAKGSDGEAVPITGDMCNWTGKYQDLQKHEKECEFQVVACELEGCNHQCRRKDMSRHHLSGDGFLHHMKLLKVEHKKEIESTKQSIEAQCKKEIESTKQSIEAHQKKEIESMKQSIEAQCKKEIESMKQSIEAQSKKEIESMKQSIEAQSKKEIESMKQSIEAQSKKEIESIKEENAKLTQKVLSMQKEITGLKENDKSIEAEYKKEIESTKKATGKKIASMQKAIARLQDVCIEGCGIEEINGVYRRSGELNGYPKYSKKGLWNAKEVEYTLYRGYWREGSPFCFWHISILGSGEFDG